MTNRLEIHGLDLTSMGIGDTVECNSMSLEDMMRVDLERGMAQFAQHILGSITFGPVQFVDLPDPEDEDFDWEYAE